MYRMPLLLVLGLTGCGDEAGYPQPPVTTSVVLTDGDKLICSDSIFKVGLPSENGNPWPTVIGFGKRWFECRVEHDPSVAKPKKKNDKQEPRPQPPVIWQKVKSTTIMHTPLGTIVREPPSYP